MRKIYRFLLRIHVVFFVLIGLLIDFAMNMIVEYFIPVDDSAVVTFLSDVGIMGGLLYGVIFLPIIETAIFQALIIVISRYLLSKINVRHYIFPVLISASVFGLSHCYNLAYVVAAFVAGCIYAFFYILSGKREECPIIVIAIMHALHNLAAFFQDFFFN